MSKYSVHISYPELGWVPVRWAPIFDSKEEADAWISGDHDWDGRVEAFEMEEEN
jgi:hypothetical protein